MKNLLFKDWKWTRLRAASVVSGKARGNTGFGAELHRKTFNKYSLKKNVSVHSLVLLLRFKGTKERSIKVKIPSGALCGAHSLDPITFNTPEAQVEGSELDISLVYTGFRTACYK